MSSLFGDIDVSKLCTEHVYPSLVHCMYRLLGLYRCAGCNRPMYTLCSTCRKGLRYVASVAFLANHLPKMPHTAPLHLSFFQYTKIVKKLFAVYKFQFAFQYQRDLEQLMNNYASLDPFLHIRNLVKRISEGNPTPLVLLPVPMTKSKLQERGFSPAYEIAVILGRLLADRGIKPICLATSLVEKTKNTLAQSKKHRTQRLLSLVNSFAVNADALTAITALNPHFFIIIDDVYTTGATITEVRETLERAGIYKHLPNIQILSFSFAESEKILH